jgi:hypothetical protein
MRTVRPKKLVPGKLYSIAERLSKEDKGWDEEDSSWIMFVKLKLRSENTFYKLEAWFLVAGGRCLPFVGKNEHEIIDYYKIEERAVKDEETGARP